MIVLAAFRPLVRGVGQGWTGRLQDCVGNPWARPRARAQTDASVLFWPCTQAGSITLQAHDPSIDHYWRLVLRTRPPGAKLSQDGGFLNLPLEKQRVSVIGQRIACPRCNAFVVNRPPCKTSAAICASTIHRCTLSARYKTRTSHLQISAGTAS